MSKDNQLAGTGVRLARALVTMLYHTSAPPRPALRNPAGSAGQEEPPFTYTIISV